MAYRRRSTTQRRYPAASRYGASRRAYSAVRGAPSRRKRATSRAPNIVKLVIEHTGLSPVARPEAAGLVEKKSNRAKF